MKLQCKPDFCPLWLTKASARQPPVKSRLPRPPSPYPGHGFVECPSDRFRLDVSKRLKQSGCTSFSRDEGRVRNCFFCNSAILMLVSRCTILCVNRCIPTTVSFIRFCEQSGSRGRLWVPCACAEAATKLETLCESVRAARRSQFFQQLQSEHARW